MGAPFNPFTYGLEQGHQKWDQFLHWGGDQLGLNPNYGKVTPKQIDTSRYDQDRANQTALLAQLQSQANGTGPSQAQGLLQQATDRNISQAMALGAAQQGQGLGYASALRNIADQSAAARQQGAGQAALLKNQEMLQGQNSLMGLLSGMSGQDLGLAGQQASLGYNYDALNQNVQMQNRDRLGNIISGAAQAIPVVGGLFKGGGGQAPAPPVSGPLPLAHGGMVDGYAGGGPVDSPAHDTVPAMLSPGEIVLPVSVAQSPDAEQRAAEFVAEVRGDGGGGPGGHLAKISALEKRIAALEGKKRAA